MMPSLAATFMNESELIKRENGVAISCSAFYLLSIVPLLMFLILTTFRVKSHYPHFADKKTEAL